MMSTGCGLYDYGCGCRTSGTSASRIDTLVSSFRYVGDVFKFPGATEAANSQRVKGASHDMILLRQPRVQADALTSAMLCWLEIAAFSLADDYERMIAGFCLYCCYGRLRCSDANRTRHGSMVGKFFEGALSRTKTARSKEKASSFIPLVVPAFGILGKMWLKEFLAARLRLGLVPVPVPTLESKAHDLNFVLVPERTSTGYDSHVPIGLTELTDRMVDILRKGFSEAALRSSQSFPESYAASLCQQLGCDLTTSELLGYRVNKSIPQRSILPAIAWICPSGILWRWEVRA